MKKIVAVLMVVFGIMLMVSCDSGSTSGGSISVIGKWYMSSGSGNYLEFKNNGDFIYYHAPSNSFVNGKFTYTLNDLEFVINITNVGWGNNNESLTLFGFIDQNGKALNITSATGWDSHLWHGSWVK